MLVLSFMLSEQINISLLPQTFFVDKFVECPHIVHFQNYFYSYVIHTSQYSPIRSQFCHLFPFLHRAIIPPR